MGLKTAFKEMTLRRAAKRGDTEKLRKLAKDGVNLNAIGQSGETPLAMAAKKGQLEAVRQLIDSGADVNACGYGGPRPLVLAIENGHAAVAGLLIDNGADLNATGGDDIRGVTPLAAAARRGDTPMICLLLDKGAKIELSGYYRGTALLVAAEAGQVEAVRTLLERGANPHSAWEALGTMNHSWPRDQKTRDAIVGIFHAELAAEAGDRARRHRVPVSDPCEEVPGLKERNPPGFRL